MEAAELTLEQIASLLALAVEFVAVLIAASGALEALVSITLAMLPGRATHGRRKEIWRRFGGWLILALEFELAADIMRSTIAPGWLEIGQLGAIAVIRTFLNYFLEQDIERAGDVAREVSVARPTVPIAE